MNNFTDIMISRRKRTVSHAKPLVCKYINCNTHIRAQVCLMQLKNAKNDSFYIVFFRNFASDKMKTA